MLKKLTTAVIIMVGIALECYAANFSPNLLRLSAPKTIFYDFDDTELQLPVTVSGTPAGVILCVYTKDKAESINAVHNGNLGWHYVNKVDTSVYISDITQVAIGSNTITWDGRDDDGALVPSGEYTYYLFGFDNVNTKSNVCKFITNRAGVGGKQALIQELDEDGIPLANPVWYGKSGLNKWVIGNDPDDESLLETTEHEIPEEYSVAPAIGLHPDDHSKYYLRAANTGSNCQRPYPYELGTQWYIPDRYGMGR